MLQLHQVLLALVLGGMLLLLLTMMMMLCQEAPSVEVVAAPWSIA